MKLGLAYALMLSAGAAQAGAWEEFERRCLVPIENVRAPVTEGLEFVDQEVDAGFRHKGFRTSTDYSNFILSYDDAGRLVACSVTVAQDGPEEFVRKFLDAVSAKKKIVLDDRTYSEEKCVCAMLLHSDQTREPVLALKLDFGASSNSWILTSKDTDLES